MEGIYYGQFYLMENGQFILQFIHKSQFSSQNTCPIPTLNKGQMRRRIDRADSIYIKSLNPFSMPCVTTVLNGVYSLKI